MERRHFLTLPAVSAAFAATLPEEPQYRIVSPYQRDPKIGMPGRFPGRVVSCHSEQCVDTQTAAVNKDAVRSMMARGMLALTGEKDVRDAWRQFFSPGDQIGIKLNCSGAPQVMSAPEVVGEIARNLVAAGLPARNITLYERFDDQLASVPYAAHVPEGVQITAVEVPKRSLHGYDPNVYVETNFFGEEDTRSNLVRLVSERFTKIINVPNMKDHGAAGVTGCLKNIAYGNFGNVARSHYREKTNTLSFIGTLASVEPLRSKAVLNVMDGLRGVWHGGPFVRDPRFVFYPKQLLFGTDPVAIDRVLLDVIEEKRRAEGAVSVWDRSLTYVHPGASKDPNRNAFIREPGHIAYAGRKGLGVYDLQSIRHDRIQVES